MNFKIVTDSSADIKELSGVPFESVPLKIITDEREYVDNSDLDVNGMLFDLKKYSGRSHTSCPSSGEYMQAFGDCENIFCITITSNLSGSCNAANVAARGYLEEHPEIADEVEAKVRENLYKMNSTRKKAPAQAAAKAVDVSADDFSDETK